MIGFLAYLIWDLVGYRVSFVLDWLREHLKNKNQLD
jgi:hypothetical protein